MAVVSSLLSFLCCLLVITIFVSQASTEPAPITVYCYDDTTSDKYITNSNYHTNLNTLLSNLTSSNTKTNNNYGFYNLSYGQNPDKVFAIGLCRGDIRPDKCSTCLNNARVNLTRLCANQKEAIIWYDDQTCMLRYSDHAIFGLMENDDPAYYKCNIKNATNADRFDISVEKLMENLTSIAASGDSRQKYATGRILDPNNNQTIYGLVQCTPDLSGPQCSSYLNYYISYLLNQNYCGGMIGGRIFTTSCNLRFEIYTFYDDTSSTVVVDTVNATSTPPPPLLPSTTSQDAPPPSLLPPPPSPGPTTTNTSTGGARKSSWSRNVVVAVGVLVVVTVVLSFICIYIRVRRSSKSFEPQVHDADDDVEITIVESLQFKFATIRDATNDFSDSNKLGQGGFGVVYRGKLSDGLDIAIKRLSSGSSQGIIEFKNEVVLLAKLQHRNLVRLHGFCIEGRERILVYEFVHNRSLDYFLFDQTRRARLDWGRRYKIIQGIARGILYLHEDSRLRIIHHDLKAGNILLDEEMNPKIADFGMARLCHADQSQGDTNRIVGTYGYMAPEYAMRGHFSAKSDVFSFGVMVLEIVSGRKNSSINHGENIKALLTSITWRNWREGTTTNIVDPTINNGSNYEIMRCIHIGLLCVQKNATARPTMGDIVSMLNNDSVNLIVPSKPAFFVDSRTEFLPNMHSGEYNSGATRSLESNQSTNKTTNVSINDASITELHPR